MSQWFPAEWWCVGYCPSVTAIIENRPTEQLGIMRNEVTNLFFFFFAFLPLIHRIRSLGPSNDLVEKARITSVLGGISCCEIRIDFRKAEAPLLSLEVHVVVAITLNTIILFSLAPALLFFFFSHSQSPNNILITHSQ